jgi:5'-nucleotidase
MRVLVTNDDGVEAPGLRALATALAAAGHDVVVVAPTGQRSGSGAAIGRLHRGGPLACTEVEWPDLPDVAVYSLDVPPAAAVYAGILGTFGPPPDFVASGINPGLNYGHLVLHSGTVGAALSAAALGRPALAVSIAFAEQEHWETATAVAVAGIDWCTADAPGRPPAPRVLNLNVPNVALADLRGIREAPLSGFGERWATETRPGEIELTYVGWVDGAPVPGTDAALVAEGYATATPLGLITALDTGPDSSPAAAIAATLQAR